MFFLVSIGELISIRGRKNGIHLTDQFKLVLVSNSTWVGEQINTFHLTVEVLRTAYLKHACVQSLSSSVMKRMLDSCTAKTIITSGLTKGHKIAIIEDKYYWVSQKDHSVLIVNKFPEIRSFWLNSHSCLKSSPNFKMTLTLTAFIQLGWCRVYDKIRMKPLSWVFSRWLEMAFVSPKTNA